MEKNEKTLQTWGGIIADNLELNLVVARGDLPFTVVALRKAYFESIAYEVEQNTLAGDGGYFVYIDTYSRIANIAEDEEVEKIKKIHLEIQHAHDEGKLNTISQEDMNFYSHIQARISWLSNIYTYEMLQYLDDIEPGKNWMKGVKKRL